MAHDLDGAATEILHQVAFVDKRLGVGDEGDEHDGFFGCQQQVVCYRTDQVAVQPKEVVVQLAALGDGDQLLEFVEQGHGL